MAQPNSSAALEFPMPCLSANESGAGCPRDQSPWATCALPVSAGWGPSHGLCKACRGVGPNKTTSVAPAHDAKCGEDNLALGHNCFYLHVYILPGLNPALTKGHFGHSSNH